MIVDVSGVVLVFLYTMLWLSMFQLPGGRVGPGRHRHVIATRVGLCPQHALRPPD
jgi:hypothetical protein